MAKINARRVLTGFLLASILVIVMSSFASAWFFEEAEINQPYATTQDKWTYTEDNHGHNQGFTLTHTSDQPQYNYYVRTDTSDTSNRGYVNWGSFFGNNNYNGYNSYSNYGNNYDTQVLKLAMTTYENRHDNDIYYNGYNRPSYFGYGGYASYGYNRVNWWN